MLSNVLLCLSEGTSTPLSVLLYLASTSIHILCRFKLAWLLYYGLSCCSSRIRKRIARAPFPSPTTLFQSYLNHATPSACLLLSAFFQSHAFQLLCPLTFENI